VSRKKVVFIIDDDESVRDAFSLALVDEPYQVLGFEHGKDAIAEAAKGRPDLVFLDLNMPGMDGVEVMHELLKTDPSIRVYVVTAFADEYMARLREARNAGLTFQIASKPISDEQIRLIAESTLG
jgi:two-component system response regulator AtoC